jgi:hypothetical protein
MSKLRRAFRVLEIAGLDNGEIELHTEGYAEPGYTDPESGIIATGNWNDPPTPERVTRIFEKLGIEIEWGDEWAACDECHKLFRTQPDSYMWRRSYWLDEMDGDIRCRECVLEDPTDMLEQLEGKDDRALTFDMDLAAHGYVRQDGEYESGWHPGQDDNPKTIADTLRAKGIGRFLFKVDGVGQFDVRFSLWVHESEVSRG